MPFHLVNAVAGLSEKDVEHILQPLKMETKVKDLFIFAYWKSLSTSNVSYFNLKFHCEEGGKAPNTRK